MPKSLKEKYISIFGFEKNKMDRFPKQEVATTCLNFIKYMLSEK